MYGSHGQALISAWARETTGQSKRALLGSARMFLTAVRDERPIWHAKPGRISIVRRSSVWLEERETVTADEAIPPAWLKGKSGGMVVVLVVDVLFQPQQA